ncbi:uncharacterized protein HPF13_0062 [Helicobacter pylori]|nr:uncharacterized protein HPF13_0062 [Helicobacter pylori]BAW44940.1 uncharacterized protein HPF211_0060 [Helicobacter pylori]BAW58775.1 uncharacterized protein HPF67_0063 [Helicobacter pylori]BAW60331.1 uncharacterized protein HPF70_0064 [Helicobacter pylori]BAW66674.1 uncharacterized protein HPF90_0064 [Helicobacter pylori]
MLKLASCISLATLMRVSFKSYNIIGFWHSKIDLQKNTIISINIVSFLTPFKRTQVLGIKENLYQVLLELS